MATDIQKVRFNVKSQYYKAMCSVGTAPCKTLTFSFCLRTVFLMEVVHVGLFWNLWIFCWVFGGWIKLGLPKNKSSCSYVLKTDQNFRTLSWWRRGHQKALAFAFPKMSQYAATCPLQKKKQKNGCRDGAHAKGPRSQKTFELHSLCSKDETWTFIGQMIYTPCGSSLIFRYMWHVRR